MDQNRNQPPGEKMNPKARGQQQSTQEWDGRDRRTGTPDRRQHPASQGMLRNTTADTRMMNEGSSR